MALLIQTLSVQKLPVDTGSADMFAMYAYVAAAIASVLLVLLFNKEKQKRGRS